MSEKVEVQKEVVVENKETESLKLTIVNLQKEIEDMKSKSVLKATVESKMEKEVNSNPSTENMTVEKMLSMKYGGQ